MYSSWEKEDMSAAVVGCALVAAGLLIQLALWVAGIWLIVKIVQWAW